MTTRRAVVVSLGILVAGLAVPWVHFARTAHLEDVVRYHRFAELILDRHELPYRDFFVEYPPGAIPVFLAPSIVGRSLHTYGVAFEWLIVAALAVMILAVAATLAPGRATPVRVLGACVFVALAPILLGRAFYTRFDAVPAALAAAALACSARRRDIPSGVLLGLAAAVKIYPLVLLPLFVLKALGERGRRGAVAVAGGFAAALAIVAGPFAVLGAGGVRFSVHVQATRRTALESLTGAALLAADKLGWYAARIHEGLTFELAGSPASVLGATESVVLALVVVSVWAMFWRSQRRDPELVTACAAAVAATIVFHKVLSPQYLIWAVPLVALVAGRLGMLSRVLLAGAMILTAAYFPHRYRELRFGGGAVWILLARNVLLLALAAVLVGAVFRASASRPSRPCRSSRRGRAASAAG